MEENKNLGRALGGKKRAENLSKKERVDIAKIAANSRWKSKTQTNKPLTGNLRIGDLSVPCAVLSNGERVVSRKGLATIIGKKTGGGAYKTGTTYLASNLKDFITDDVQFMMNNPIEYKIGRSIYYGYKAEIIPKICEIWLKARDADCLTHNQKSIAIQAELVTRMLAQMGIVSLIDEATGYQEIRDRDELQKILDLYLSREFSVWAKKIPDEFYQHIFRLRGWQWKGMQINRPQVVAKYTKDLIYARLAPGILNELETLNPVKGNYRHQKHHQWLTEDIGHPKLAEHIYAIIALMRVSTEWEEFVKIVDKALPKKEETLKMPSMIDVYSNDIELIEEENND